LTIVNDGCTDDSNKLGAIGDLHLVLTQHRIDEDVIVVAGDISLAKGSGVWEFCAEERSRPGRLRCRYHLDEIRKYNAIEIDRDGTNRFLRREACAGLKAHLPELPSTTSRFRCRHPSVYGRETTRNQPGRLVQWCTRGTFYTWQVPGIWYDVVRRKTLEEANRIFSSVVLIETVTPTVIGKGARPLASVSELRSICRAGIGKRGRLARECWQSSQIKRATTIRNLLFPLASQILKGKNVAGFDALVAQGTHPPMTESQKRERLVMAMQRYRLGSISIISGIAQTN